MPFVTILLRDRGLDFDKISLVFFAASSTLLVFPFLWGMLADRYIPINRLFTLLNLAALGALAVLATQQSFLGLILSFTLFYACFNPTLTLLNALCFHYLREPQKQFAKLRSWGSVGWILPSLPIYFWLSRATGHNLDSTIYLGMAMCLLMALATLLLPHTPPGAASSPLDPVKRLGYWPALRKLMSNPSYMVLLVSYFLMAASFSILIYYSPPYLEDAGVARAWIGPVQCIGVVIEIILFRWTPGLMSGWRYSRSITFGCLCLAARHWLFASTENPWLLSLSYVLAGLVIVFYNIGVSILVNAIAGLEVRATAQTLLVFFGSGMGPMFANWAAGLLAGHYGNSLRPVFLFAAVLAGGAALLILMRGAKLDLTRH